MNLLTLSTQNLRSRPLSTFLSLLLLTLGVSIISLLIMLGGQLRKQFDQNIKGIDMVVGAKGSPLQLILASVYHIDNPTGNIPLSEAETLAGHPLVEMAIPLAYGDNFNGYRILGTDSSLVSHYEGKMAQGRLWAVSFEATVGARVAERNGLKIGDTFLGSHGLSNANDVHDAHPFTVVGILEPSGTVLDQLILTAIESVWETHGDYAGEEEAEEEGKSEETHEQEDDREITAMLIGFRSPMGMVMLPRMINGQTSMQAAVPAIEINRLFGLFSVGIDTLRAIAFLIMVISGISVFISLYNSLRERKYEMALMRTMGGGRGQLLSLLLLEGLLLALVGFLLGICMARLGMLGVDLLAQNAYHYGFADLGFVREEAYLFGITLGIGILAAALPAWQAARLNISETLAG